MYGSPTSKKPKPTATYPIKPKLNLSKPLYTYNADKKKRNKRIAKMEYRKRPDYADTAYREAVGRLRILLAESYTPISKPLRELDSGGEETDNQSLISVKSTRVRPYYHYLKPFPKRFYSTTFQEKKLVSPRQEAVPPELMSFIEKQEDYIEQLERESKFCREELSSLLGKVKDVISENENLHERQKSSLMKTVFNHLETETETETDLELKPKPKPKFEGPSIVFESRISELEAQLTQAKIDLRKALEENENRKKDDFLDGANFEHYRKQIDHLQREKEVLQETIAQLQTALSKLKNRETDTTDHIKKSLEAAEQAHYEKNAAELEIRRLKDELERQHLKLRDAIADQSRRISDERSAVERRYTQQIDQLTSELSIQWETTNKLQLELDKQRRENGDLRREIAQKQALLDGMKKDLQNKIMNLQSDIGVNGAEKSALEQQIATLQMLNERNERQYKQEITRLQAEMQSLRQRLDRADADLIHSRRENIRLSEQVASLEKEVKLNSAVKEEKAEALALPPPKDLSSVVQDMDSKHAASIADLEGVIQSQNQLMDKLAQECQHLTQKLEDATAKHKEEIRELQTNLKTINSRLFNPAQITPVTKAVDYTSSPQKSSTSSISADKIAPAQPPESIKYKQPTDTDKQPDTSHQQPADTFKQPANTYRQPADAYQQPADTYQQPADTYQQPADTYQQPADTYQQPADTYQQPDTYEQQADSYQQPADMYTSEETYDPQYETYPQGNEMYETDPAYDPNYADPQYMTDPGQHYDPSQYQYDHQAYGDGNYVTDTQYSDENKPFSDSQAEEQSKQ